MTLNLNFQRGLGGGGGVRGLEKNSFPVGGMELRIKRISIFSKEAIFDVGPLSWLN